MTKQLFILFIILFISHTAQAQSLELSERFRSDFSRFMGGSNVIVGVATESQIQDNRQNRNPQFNTRQNQLDIPAPKQLIRTKLNVDFEYNKVSPEIVEKNLIKYLSKIGDIRISIKDDGTTIDGEVELQHKKRLVELIVKLEPGIYSVENRIIISEN